MGFLLKYSMNEILIFPNPVLRKKSKEILKVGNELKKEIESVKKGLTDSENGAGLAAVQLGILRRFFVIKKEGKLRVLINPKIVKTVGEPEWVIIDRDDGGQEGFLEGCLSFPGFFGRVKRWLVIEVVWEEIKGDRLVKKETRLSGFEAVVWQHERDHLDGIMFVDRVKKDKGKFYRWEGGQMIKWKVGDLLKEEKTS